MTTPLLHSEGAPAFSPLLRAILQPGDLVEVRVIWPDRDARRGTPSRWSRCDELCGGLHDDWMRDMSAQGYGIYFGPNPRDAVGGRSIEHVVVTRSLFADFDNGATVEAALAVIRRAGFPFPTATVMSGHGVHVYWRLRHAIEDLGVWTRLQKALIGALAGTDRVIHDPPRVMRLPGYLNTKPPPARSCIVEVQDDRVYDEGAFPQGVRPLRVTVAARPIERLPLSGSSRAFALNGSEEGHRNARLFKAAADHAGCGYTRQEAEGRLLHVATGSGLSESEARGVIDSAYSKPRTPSIPVRQSPGGPQDIEPAQADGPVPLGQCDPDTGRLVLSPKRTLPTAESFLDQFHAHPDGPTLVCYGDVLHAWRENRYVPIDDGDANHQIQPWLHSALRYVKRGNRPPELAPFESNPATIKSALDSIKAYAHLPSAIPIPSWLSGVPEDPDPTSVLPCRSASLHLPTRRIIPATPRLFTTCALDFDYDPDPEPPLVWIHFIEQLFGDDLESVQLLQEWMGYCLTGDTSLQKMLLMMGPKRSGKGTIARVLRRLVGMTNVAGPTTGGLAGPFGLQCLVGMILAIVSDARFTGEGMGAVVERLLCISGEDAITVDRKFLPSLTVKLPTRFMFLTNEVPRFNDISNALTGRFLALRLTRSFFGQEDPTLTDRLYAELPGILSWAIEGWGRLHARGRFVQPQGGKDILEEMEDLSSPVTAFVREYCLIGPGHRTLLDDLYARWLLWCQRDGRNIGTTKMSFGRDLGTAFPSVKRRRGTKDVSFYEGIALKGPL